MDNLDSKNLPMLRWSTAALVLSGYFALASVPHLGPLVLLLPLIAIALSSVGERLHTTYPIYGVITRALTIAYLCFLPLSVLTLSILNAVMLLVAFIQIYTLLHRKGPRNYYHLHLMSLFILLAACVQSPEPVIGLAMLGFLISAVWASLSLRLAAEEYRARDVMAPEMVGLDNLETQSIHGGIRFARGNMPLLSASLSAIMLAMTIVFFMFTPRIEAGIFGRNQDAMEMTGIPEEVDISGGAVIEQDTTPVMHVRFPDEPNGQVASPDLLYWRIATLGRYIENTWQRQRGTLFDPGIAHIGYEVRNPDEHLLSEGLVSRTRREDRPLVRQEIYLDVIPPSGIPVLHLVQSVRITEQVRRKRVRWSRDGDLSVSLDRTSGVHHLNYEAHSEPGGPTAEELRAAPPFTYEEGDIQAASFLAHNLSEQSVALARQLTERAENAYDKAMEIIDHLNSPNYRYSLVIPDMGNVAVIDKFINETRMGHCELFGTALALMLRSQGVPTRVVSGYRGGDWSAADQAYIVRANMAHLWVEAWFPGVGWAIMDPSPQIDTLSTSRRDQFALFLSGMALRARMFWFQDVVGFDGASQVARLRDVSLGLVRDFLNREDEDSELLAASASASRRSWFDVLTGLPMLFMTLAIFWAFVWWRRRPVDGAFPLNRDQIKVVGLYMKLRRYLKRHGVDCRGKTAEELRAALEGERWGAPAAAIDLLECYNRVRFGGGPLRPGQLAELRRGLKKIRPREGVSPDSA